MLNRNGNDNNKTLRDISILLDVNIFSPIFKSYNSNSNDLNHTFAKLICGESTLAFINERLQTIKVSTFVLGGLFVFSSPIQLSKGHPISFIFYLISGIDLLHISYNCYIEKYLHNARLELGGTVESLGSTALSMASSALGFSNKPTPLQVLQQGVYWPAVLNGTMVKQTGFLPLNL